MWIPYFDTGKVRHSGYAEHMLAYSWLALPNGFEEGLNSFVFLMVILLEKGKGYTQPYI